MAVCKGSCIQCSLFCVVFFFVMVGVIAANRQEPNLTEDMASDSEVRFPSLDYITCSNVFSFPPLPPPFLFFSFPSPSLSPSLLSPSLSLPPSLSPSLLPPSLSLPPSLFPSLLPPSLLPSLSLPSSLPPSSILFLFRMNSQVMKRTLRYSPPLHTCICIHTITPSHDGSGTYCTCKYIITHGLYHFITYAERGGDCCPFTHTHLTHCEVSCDQSCDRAPPPPWTAGSGQLGGDNQ